MDDGPHTQIKTVLAVIKNAAAKAAIDEKNSAA